MALQLEITDKVQQSTLFQVEIMYHTECLIYYSVKEEDMYSTIKDKKYFNRINTKRINLKNTDAIKTGSNGDRAEQYPVCEQYHIKFKKNHSN